MRLLKPHSLSYQAITLTKRPLTRVCVASKLEENALWLKSIDTNGSWFTASTSLNGATDAAFSIMALISSTVVSRAATKDKID